MRLTLHQKSLSVWAMHTIRQKINWPAIIGQLGLLLHIPAGMAFLTLGIALIFREWFALIPFGTIAIASFILGQIFFRTTKGAKAAHLWDAMVIAGLGWLICSLIAALPFVWIASLQIHDGIQSELLLVFRNPTNSFFEAISGFTSTGLTMMQRDGVFPNVFHWWRSFLEWMGGLGLIVCILSFVHLNKEGFQLYYAEARSEKMTKDVSGTTHWIWRIYLCFTAVAFLLFFFSGMSAWEAINHAMTAVSTGGFTLSQSSFQDYNVLIQISAMLMMLVGAISFAIHFRVIREKEFAILWRDWQLRLLYIFAIGGGLFILFLSWINDFNGDALGVFFEWFSALTTCGFSAISPALLSPMVKLFLIIGMFIGGTTGSTAGGIKIRRLIYLVSGIVLRVLAITTSHEKHTTQNKELLSGKEPPGVELPHSELSERLFTAGVLFSLWTSTLFLGWLILLKWIPKGRALDALFDLTSAMSNVGLSTGIINPAMATFPKWIFIVLMWIGRLEIIPALILFLTIPLIPVRSISYGKKP